MYESGQKAFSFWELCPLTSLIFPLTPQEVLPQTYVIGSCAIHSCHNLPPPLWQILDPPLFSIADICKIVKNRITYVEICTDIWIVAKFFMHVVGNVWLLQSRLYQESYLLSSCTYVNPWSGLALEYFACL